MADGVPDGADGPPAPDPAGPVTPAYALGAGGVQLFAAAVSAGPSRLDLCALAISEHCGGLSGAGSQAALDSLDSLAGRVAEHSFDGVIDLVFNREGFAGDATNYASVDNCFVDRVLARRRGIPVTLAVVAMEVARRVDVVAHGIGMPGHFLLGAPDGTLYDCFERRPVDEDGAREIFTRLRPEGSFNPGFLQPVEPQSIARRMLLNLHGHYSRALGAVAQPAPNVLRRKLNAPSEGHARLNRGRTFRRSAGTRSALAPLIAVMELSVCLPDARPGDFEHLAQLLVGAGRFDEAARQLAAGAQRAEGDDQQRMAANSERLWARLN